jgi:hypothetical protein
LTCFVELIGFVNFGRAGQWHHIRRYVGSYINVE